jgi:hypothetical protein
MMTTWIIPSAGDSMLQWLLQQSGSLRISGGNGVDGNGHQGELNDLWKFDPAHLFKPPDIYRGHFKIARD